MVSKSWEIIVAGLVFIGISMYIINNKSSDSSADTTTAMSDSVVIHVPDLKIKSITLNNLQNLENLRQLENLQELGNLEKLEKLKALANYMPVEVKNDFVKEIDRAIKEKNREMDIQVDIRKGLISIEQMKEIEPGLWSVISPGVYAFVKEFDASELTKTSLEIPLGSITVVGTDQKTARLVIQASGKIESNAYLQDRLNTKVEISNDEAHFRIQSKKSSDTENLHLQATLNVPENIALSMKTLGGHIQASNVDGNQTYATNGGHITLNKLAGEVHANTKGGHISIAHSTGNFDLKTEGGHIKVADHTGDMILKTSGGNISCENVIGALQAKTAGGNVDIALPEFTGPVEAVTRAGMVTISLDRSANAHLEATGNTVELDSDFTFSGSKTGNKIDGEIGAGGRTISAKTEYGKVVIKNIED